VKNYLLNDYNLSSFQLVHSVFVSEYGLRHWSESIIYPERKWGHRIIAAIEFIPLVGLVATIIEAIVAKIFCSQEKPSQDQPWIFRGDQVISCPVDQAKVEVIRARLDRCKPPGIRFNPEKIGHAIDQPVEAGGSTSGVCTAMSLEFLAQYFKLKTKDDIAQLGPFFAHGSCEFTHQQLAYNTIEVDRQILTDYTKAKIQALANFHSFRISHASPEIDVTQLQNEAALSRMIDSLPPGSYLLRTIQPLQNERLEQWGHSMVYIKDATFSGFYDPNEGLRSLNPSDQIPVLYRKLKQCLANFQTTNARFYQMTSGHVTSPVCL
jgi:hypothetical protein